MLIYPPTTNGLQKTLGAALDQGITASATLNNVTGIQNKKGLMIINRIDTNGAELDASLREYITFAGTSGSTVVTLTRGLGGTTDQDHAIGSVVEFVSDVVQMQAILDALDGTSTDLVLNTPKLLTGINDTNGNELLKITATGSAVNEVTLANAATGNGPTISTTGSDTDIDLNLTPKGAGDINIPTSANIQVNNADPKRGLYIDGASMKARTTSGAASSSTETTTNKVMKTGFAFDKDSDEFIQFKIPAPKYWDLGTITATPHWTADAGTTGTVAWAVQALAVSNDDALDTAFGTAVTSTDTFIATGDLHIGPATTAITVGNTPAKGDMLIFQVYRDVSEDTFDADAILIGLDISFGISQYDDQ